MADPDEGDVPKLVKVQFVAMLSQNRFERAINAMIAELIRNFAVHSKAWRVRVSTNIACGLTEFYSPHGRVEIEVVTAKRTVCEIETLPE